MNRLDLTTTSWDDYELLDSGDDRKLERFGALVLDRPDPQALWKKSRPDAWLDAHAAFSHGERGEWTKNPETSSRWTMNVSGATVTLSLAAWKHIGIFPEHKAQWDEIATRAAARPGLRVLNLFGYTGIPSTLAALSGASVTHVDASKQTLATLRENMEHSGLSADRIRIVCEDALKYAKRLVARGETFDLIVMDPPAFGRGPSGEVWKIEEKLPELVALIPALLSNSAELVILNGYASGYSARVYGTLLDEALAEKGGEILYGDVGILETSGARTLPTGIYAAWRRA